MARKSAEMKAKVEARRKQEAAARAERGRKPVEVSKIEISNDDLLGYFNENRVGDAKLYSRLHRGTVIYVKYWDRFLIWGGHHWIEDDFDMAAQRIEDVCELYLRLAESKQAEAAEETDKNERAKIEGLASAVLRRVSQLRDTPGQDKLLQMLRRIRDPLVVLPKQIDQQHYVKACPNGVIDLRTGELRPGRPDEYILNAIVTEYDPELLRKDDPCPETNRFLLSSMDGDQELVDFIWRLLGYGLITERRDHIFTIMWGEHGRNGKDTLIKLVTHVLGQTLSGDVPVEMFLQMQQTRNSSAPSPDVLALRGMCVAWINEAEEGQRFALAKLKKLTGGGYITARGLQDKLQTTWLQTHLPIMTTNELPKAKADDAAFWARAVLIKWPLSFVERPEQPYERPADKDLNEKIGAEAKGVLARMVRGSMEYLRDGLKIPDKVREWTREQRASWDDVGLFLSEWCISESHQANPANYTLKVNATDLHEAFCIWYARYRDRRYSISAKKFAEALNKKDIAYKRSNGSWRLGIDLTDEARKELDSHRA
ncbi:MAG TPA: DNA primase [Desulfovibrio piger]|uniref:Phage/plasmid primase, P4 family domain protein n=1 Tax=Desulfovibrio piger ATCC 29098 TaxID=411464 RepID=B6WRM7_9BACT|nr:phage/plasmid primase, P4 family domain protein [Desulfovibrio piger ATCC 29098]HCZ43957.1 DNA primase [Desulfovibrio piger]